MNKLDDKNIICLDTETTGLDQDRDEVLSIGIIDRNRDILLDSYVRPQRHRQWPEAERVNHISWGTVAGAPTMDELREKIQNIIDAADIIVGYNIKFDLGFLQRAGIKTGGKHIEDVMLIYAEGRRWPKLAYCAADCGYDWGDTQAHGSLADAKATLFCWWKIGPEKAEKALMKETRRNILDHTRYNYEMPRSPFRNFDQIRYVFGIECRQRIEEIGEEAACEEWVREYYPEWCVGDFDNVFIGKEDILRAAAKTVMEGNI